MSKFNFEILLIPKKEQYFNTEFFYRLININNDFNIDKEILKFNIDDNFILEFKTNLYVSSKALTITLNAQIDSYWRYIYIYDEFKDKINSLLGSKYEVTFLSNELSKYYANKCYPYIYDYEVNLRKLLYLMFHFNDIDDVQKLVKNNKVKFKRGHLNNFVEGLSLSELEDFIFSKIWFLNSNGNWEIIEFSSREELINKLSSIDEKPIFKSSWQIFIQPVIKYKEISNKQLKNIREIRNKVSHFKEMNYSDLDYCKNNIKNLSDILHDIKEKMLANEFYVGPDFEFMKQSLVLLSKKIEIITEKLNNIDSIIKILKGFEIPKIVIPNDFYNINKKLLLDIENLTPNLDFINKNITTIQNNMNMHNNLNTISSLNKKILPDLTNIYNQFIDNDFFSNIMMKNLENSSLSNTLSKLKENNNDNNKEGD